MDGDPLKRLAGYQQRVASGELTEEEARAWYRLVVEVREQADYYERGLIRYLRWGCEMLWKDIATVVGVESKQGAHQRWRRMIGPRPGPGSYQQRRGKWSGGRT
jgi:hypothetical protein